MVTGAFEHTAPPRAIEALLAFWAEAGVTVSATDSAVDRLQPVTPVVTRSLPTPAVAPVRQSPVARTPAAEVATPAVDVSGVTDFAALTAAIAAFEGCALKHSGAAKPVVFRGDPATADLLVIGEAPSSEDEAVGDAFQGAQGRLVDRMLLAAGLSARAMMINTVFWRTPGAASPAAADQAACRPFLERAAAILKPKAVLVLGAAAARGVLRTDEPILKLRGRWGAWQGEHETLDLPVLATFSPAFLLAQPLAKKRAWSDLLTLAARLDPPPPAP